MRTHYLALTIDTDPDGLNKHDPDRRSLDWHGLHFAMEQFHRALPGIPLTWYVRADGQLEHAYGSVRHLLDSYADFWHTALACGDELGWHPHLYQVTGAEPTIITDETLAISELTRIHAALDGLSFELPTFRMGEAWHTPQTLNLIEHLGYAVDSTAIPGRDDSASGHPRNWRGTPNHPYFPSSDDPCQAGEVRPLLEIPMNSWHFKAPYDAAPRLRYMNPCIHADLWQHALDDWQQTVSEMKDALFVWTLILHPAEAMPQPQSDQLYAHDLSVMQGNLYALSERIQALGDRYRWVTVNHAAKAWRTAHNTTP